MGCWHFPCHTLPRLLLLAHVPSSNGADRQDHPTPSASTTSSLSHFDPGPSAAPPTSASSRTLPPAQTLHRLEQTCLRLRWKSLDLESAYRRTLEAEAYGFDRDVAERNFKIDFYEFYAWIEQALVLCQRIFGVEIMSNAGWSDGRRTHTFHHNVIQGLSAADNPLREVLGDGEVFHALFKAKELRNRWKDAADGSTETPPLGMYDLQWIFGKILGGLEQAYLLAKVEVVRSEEGRWGAAQGMNDGSQNEGWDWMVDEKMDWEA